MDTENPRRNTHNTPGLKGRTSTFLQCWHKLNEHPMVGQSYNTQNIQINFVTLWVWIPHIASYTRYILCGKGYQCLPTGYWLSPRTPIHFYYHNCLPRYYWNIVESGVKNFNNSNTLNYLVFIWFVFDHTLWRLFQCFMALSFMILYVRFFYYFMSMLRFHYLAGVSLWISNPIR